MIAAALLATREQQPVDAFKWWKLRKKFTLKILKSTLQASRGPIFWAFCSKNSTCFKFFFSSILDLYGLEEICKTLFALSAWFQQFSFIFDDTFFAFLGLFQVKWRCFRLPDAKFRPVPSRTPPNPGYFINFTSNVAISWAFLPIWRQPTSKSSSSWPILADIMITSRGKAKLRSHLALFILIATGRRIFAIFCFSSWA